MPRMAGIPSINATPQSLYGQPKEPVGGVLGKRIGSQPSELGFLSASAGQKRPRYDQAKGGGNNQDGSDDSDEESDTDEKLFRQNNVKEEIKPKEEEQNPQAAASASAAVAETTKQEVAEKVVKDE